MNAKKFFQWAWLALMAAEIIYVVYETGKRDGNGKLPEVREVRARIEPADGATAE